MNQEIVVAARRGCPTAAAWLALAFSLGAPILAAEQPFTGLGAAEAAALERGETVARSLDSARELAGGPAEAARIGALALALSPNYVTELIALVPRRAGDGALERLAAALLDVEGYVGIPYYSAQYKKTFDLFGSMRVLARGATAEGGVRIDVVQFMKPFGEYSARYELWRSPELLRFEGSNTGPISYKGFTSVKAGQMLWLVSAFPAGDDWAFYCVGAVRAFDMLGAFRDRLETSFIGRTRAFFEAMQERIRE